MAEGAGYDPADAVADATGVRDRRNYSVSAIPPCFLKWRSKRDSHPQEFLTSTGIQSRLLNCFEHCSFNGGHGGIRTRRKRALNAPRLPVAPHVRDGRAGGIRTRTALHLKQVTPASWSTAPSENQMSKIVKNQAAPFGNRRLFLFSDSALSGLSATNGPRLPEQARGGRKQAKAQT